MGKRYKSYLFIEGLEKEAYVLRIKNIERWINELKQAKDVYKKEKELAEFKMWAEEHGVGI